MREGHVNGQNVSGNNLYLLRLRYASMPGMEEVFKGTCQSI
jgi:hypothetical protein